ncbi:beta-ketoacyl synthase N-terminal-like domain-containing protein [soil metagenome]
MMKEVFLVSDNIVSPLGVNTAENFSMLKTGTSGVKKQQIPEMSSLPFYASLLSDDVALLTDKNNTYTKFELLLIASISDALEKSTVSAADKRTILIISSTKGNISLLENAPMTDALKTRIALHTSAKLIGEYFNCINTPVVVSNACISGSLALIMAKRLIQSGQYDHAIVAGADTISKFVLSGFQSFQAVSNAVCKPFDVNRTGINLGEGAATIILSGNATFSNGIKITGGSTSNDANHISGPSRTGEELCIAIKKAMQEAGITPAEIDYISAHGTATIYNDEMEAQAITLAGLQSVSTNSLKGYYGHTLGAAGLIESVATVHSLKENMVLPSIGFETMGVSTPINVSTGLQNKILNNCLKTSSGFGGCNAAVIFGKA